MRPIWQVPILASSPPTLVTNGLQALWMPALDYYSGITAQTVPDRSGKGNTLTLGSTSGPAANDPSWSQQGLAFNSAVSNYCTMTDKPLVSGDSPLTMLAVFNAASGTTASTILGYGASTTETSPMIQLNTATDVRCATWLDDLDITLSTTAVGRYLAVAWRYLGANLLDGWALSDAVHNQLTLSAAPNWSATNGKMGTVPGATGAFFDGTVATGMLYDRALSDAETQQVYRWLRAQLSPVGVVLP